MNQDNKPHDVQAEEAARSIANSLLSSFDPAVASVILTTALAFVFKCTFEQKGASPYEFSEHIKYNFIETANGMRKATIQ